MTRIHRKLIQPRQVTNIAALRALSSDNLYDTISVSGITTAGDRGGGEFFWDSTSTATDDGLETVRPTSVLVASPGRWRRSYGGEMETSLIARVINASGVQVAKVIEARRFIGGSQVGTAMYWQEDGSGGWTPYTVPGGHTVTVFNEAGSLNSISQTDYTSSSDQSARTANTPFVIYTTNTFTVTNPSTTASALMDVTLFTEAAIQSTAAWNHGSNITLWFTPQVSINGGAYGPVLPVNNDPSAPITGNIINDQWWDVVWQWRFVETLGPGASWTVALQSRWWPYAAVPANTMRFIHEGTKLVGSVVVQGMNASSPVQLRTGTASLTSTTLAAGASATGVISVSGAAMGDGVTFISHDQPMQGVELFGWVSSANVVSYRLLNSTSASVTIAAGTLRTKVMPQ